tara:strand:- start:261 stop:437 length:177 start_codon:yes stop_codon:yes gene_type:complete
MDDIDRNTRKILQYMQDMEKKVKQMKFIRDLKVEVEINGTGTHKYRYKRGPNKGKVTD